MASRGAIGGALLMTILAATTSGGGELNGSALLSTTATDSQGITSDQLEQQYGLNASQELTPYLRLRLGFQYRDLRSSFDGMEATRRSRQPRVELNYNRPGLNARVAAFGQTVEDTAQGETFERRSLAASLSWRPRWGPLLTASFHDDENLADVSVLGTGIRSRGVDAAAQYGGRFWSAGYAYGWNRLDNAANDFRTEQQRHELRGSLAKSAWSKRLSVTASGRASRVSRSLVAGDSTRLAEPLPAVAGLAAVDTTPELGELEDNPSLIDGDIRNPASPPIDVGGANTFRNVGVDLGVTRSASQLEIAVDTVSDPRLVWRVFRSRDNLFWEEVGGAVASFDTALLRYRIEFPATEDRFFKAVNISVNERPQVLVTEIRALVDVDAADLAGREAQDTDLYRADVAVGLRPTERIEAAVGFGTSTDQVVTAGIARRDFQETHAFARLGIDLASTLDAQLAWRLNQSDDRAGTPLYRRVAQASGVLGWEPLPTVEAKLTVSHRTESDREVELQVQDSVRLGVVTVLLPDLRLVSDVQRSWLEDPFAGRDRVSWTWRESLDARPLPNWNLSGGFTYSANRAPDGENLLDRKQLQISTTWSPARFVTLSGGVWVSLESGQRSTSGSFSLSYVPGDRLAVSASHQGSGSSQGRGTSSDSLSMSYRLFPRWLLFGSATRSRSEGGGGGDAEITSARAGLQVAF